LSTKGILAENTEYIGFDKHVTKGEQQLCQFTFASARNFKFRPALQDHFRITLLRYTFYVEQVNDVRFADGRKTKLPEILPHVLKCIRSGVNISIGKAKQRNIFMCHAIRYVADLDHNQFAIKWNTDPSCLVEMKRFKYFHVTVIAVVST
jgi:hypothetical protein